MKSLQVFVCTGVLLAFWSTGAQAQFGRSGGGPGQGGGVPGQGAAQSSDSGSGADVDAIAALLEDEAPTRRLQAVRALAAEGAEASLDSRLEPKWHVRSMCL